MTTKGIFTTVLAALIASTICGCSSEEDLNEVATMSMSSYDVIGFRAVGENVSTRATSTTAANLNTTNFNVYAFTSTGKQAYMGANDTNFGHNGVTIVSEETSNSWNYANDEDVYYWPEASLDFLAINPATVPAGMENNFKWKKNTNTQEIYYSAVDEYENENGPENIDIMYSVATNKTKESGKVPFNFQHILSQVLFTATTESPSIEVTIQSVKVCNIKSAGTFTIPSDNRTPQASDWNLDELTTHNTFTVVKHAKSDYQTITNAENSTLNSSPLMVIPQALTAWNTISDANKYGNYQSCLLVSCIIKQNDVCIWGKTSEDGTVTCADMYVPFGASWQPGKRYTYHLVFGGGYDDNSGKGNLVLNPVKMEVSLDAWKAEASTVK